MTQYATESVGRINAAATSIVHQLLDLDDPAEIMGTLEIVVLSLILTASRDPAGSIDFFHERLHAGLAKVRADAH